MYSRRQFLKTGAALGAASLLPRPALSSSIASLAANANGTGVTLHRLSDGWEYLQGSLGGPWEAWHSEEVAAFQPVQMPHCFNAYDGCDPDVPYYRGNGWYRTYVPIANPYPNGRTLLHFQGAGQTTTLYVGEQLIGKHVGGYDEFVFDITDAVRQLPPPAPDPRNKPKKREGVPIAVLCDNSRDIDRIPSDLSDFSLYGGLYRHVNLIYVPAVSLETVHVKIDIPSPKSPAEISLVGTLYNPSNAKDSADISIEVVDAQGTTIHTAKQKFTPWAGTKELTRFTLKSPKLWSPATPHLYECRIKVASSSGEYTARETFGVRHTEWVDHGPFKLNGERLLLRGTHRHEDHGGYAAAMPDDLIEQEMHLIKDMGANFIRLAHYQQSRRVLEFCDRLGILVWEEIPWCRGGIGNDTFKEMGRRTLRNNDRATLQPPQRPSLGLGQ